MKFRYFLIGVVLLLALAACGDAAPDNQTDTPVVTPESSGTAPETETAPPPVSTPEADPTPEAPTDTQAPSTEAVEPPAETDAAAVVVRFTAMSPVSVFTGSDIDFLGLAITGSPTEVADAIIDWQASNMNYDPARPDSSDSIRWNYILPGSFASGDIIRERTDDGKVYGICFDYATVYASIARYYGLEARVMNSISKPSELADDGRLTTGLSPDEYERLSLKLAEHGVDYPYEAVRLVAEETPTHYWVEVKLDGEWVVRDGSQVATGNLTADDFYTTDDYEVTDWMSRDQSALLVEYTETLARGERLPDEPPPTTGETHSDGEPYAGITDDLGQENRAANIDDLIMGLALAPYFNDAADVCDFIRADAVCKDLADDDNEFKAEYEAATGEKFYLVADYMLEDEQKPEYARLYELYTGVAIDMTTYEMLDME